MNALRNGRLRSAGIRVGVVAIFVFGAAIAQAKEPDRFVVHEWGTFSTFSGSNGKQLKFTPNDRDLPAFVHARHRDVKGGLADAMVSLETPVLYFYTDRDRTVSVHVDFPKGLMTDWYPQASRPPEHSIRWDDLKILATDRPKLAGERENGRYFAARETEASGVRIAGKDREEEKFLFYRGVGDFEMPFVVQARGNGAFTVKNTGKEAVPGYILVSLRDRKLSFKVFDHLSSNAEEKIALPAETSTEEKLAESMVKLLIQQGLYEKEARAMVKTWRHDWFGEEGTRVLYLLAEPVTEQFLPLKIDPKPDQRVRVLVGRHDVLTPENELDIDAATKRLNGASNAESKDADAELNRLGRYRWAAQQAAQDRLKGRDALRQGR
jgi:hypothetical protein